LATVLDPRIKDRIFSVEQRIEVKALLVKELNSLNEAKDDVADYSKELDSPPKKFSKMSTNASRIEQLLESKKQEYGSEVKASSKEIEVNDLKFD